MGERRTLVVDGNNLTHRAYHGFVGSRRGSYTPGNAPNFAVSSMISTIARRTRQISADSLVIAFDPPGGCPERRAMVASYKQNRPETPGDLVTQLESSYRLLTEAGLDVQRPEGWEADDVMATVAATRSGEVYLLTFDRDAIQAVTETTRILRPDNGAILGKEAISEKYGIPPELYPHFAAVRGEPGDGIPGIDGVGKVGALRLVQAFGTVPDILAASDDAIVAAAGRRALSAVRRDGHTALRALEAARLRTDLDLGPGNDLADLDEHRIADTFGRAGLPRTSDILVELVLRARRRRG